MSLGLSSIVILILGVAGVNDMMVGDTWLEIMFRRAGDADRLINSEGVGVLHSSEIAGISFSFLSVTTEVTIWGSKFL